MENNSKNWPYYWFGLWKEFGDNYEKYPSINDFVDKKVNKEYQTNKLINYLNNGIIVASTSRMNFPSPFTGEIKSGSISFRTDGKWLWLDNISEFIENNDLVIPENWYTEISDNRFLMPNVTKDQIESMQEQWAIGQ